MEGVEVRVDGHDEVDFRFHPNDTVGACYDYGGDGCGDYSHPFSGI
jgi:hypothetical protein